MLKVQTLPVGALATNCHLVFRKEELLCIIDPGGDAPEIAGALGVPASAKLRILLTHAHVDHISGLGGLAERFPSLEVWCRPEDGDMYYSEENALLPWLPAAENLPRLAERAPQIPGMEILALPGHTPGGAGFYFAEEKTLFAGDTLFAGSVGRTDLPGGDWDELQKSIRQTLFALPEDVAVHCGHGAPTTIGKEKHHNPYVAMEK